MKPCVIYVNSETDAKHLAYKVYDVMCPPEHRSFQPRPVELMASGNAIEHALKVSQIVKQKFNNQIHQIITTKLHLTESGEPLHEANKVDQSKLQWMMKGSGLSTNSSCQERFMFAKQQRIIPCIKIQLSREKLDTEHIGYQRPGVPILAKKTNVKQPYDNDHRFNHRRP